MNISYIQILKSMNQKKFSSLSEFHIIKEIGRGGFSKVYLSQHKKTKMNYALKKLKLRKITAADFEMMVNELKIHRELNHPNIVKFHDVIVENENLFIILEYCKDGSLFNYIRSTNLSQNKIKNIFKQILNGVEYIHKKNVIIRDLKPENIVKVGDTYKLCDFGWSVFMSNPNLRSQKAGTLAYMSPESLSGNFQYKSSDIWSLGIFLYELHFNREPFRAKSSYDMLCKIKCNNLSFPKSVISYEAEKLIRSVLRFNATERLSIKNIRNHPYLKGPLERIYKNSNYNPLKMKTVFDHLQRPEKNYSSSKNKYFYPKIYEDRLTENIVQNSKKRIVYSSSKRLNNRNFSQKKKSNFTNNLLKVPKMNFNQRFLNYSPKVTKKVIPDYSSDFFDFKSYKVNERNTSPKIFYKNIMYSY